MLLEFTALTLKQMKYPFFQDFQDRHFFTFPGCIGDFGGRHKPVPTAKGRTYLKIGYDVVTQTSANT